MTSQTKEQILAAIRSHTHKQEAHPDLASLPAITFENKTEQFTKIITAVGGQVVVLDEASLSIAQLIQAQYPEAKRFISEEPIEGLPCIAPQEIATSEEMNGTDITIVVSPLGVCENGCVWVEQMHTLRTHLFISEHLVVILDRKNLVNNMHEAYKQVRTFAPSSPFSGFISGPSKTADIEQALVMGAHGARTLTVLIK